METTLYWKNTETGEVREQKLTFIGTVGKCHNVWSDGNEYWTKGFMGWWEVSKYIK